MEISEITSTFDFTEKNYIQSHFESFKTSKLGVMKSLLPIEEFVKLFAKKRTYRNYGGRPKILHLEAQICLLIFHVLQIEF